ncbi:MAG TPA: hypothetical protein VGH23_01965 [Rhizomicrobium sp.]
MRAFLLGPLAAMLIGSAALGADFQTPLPPGKPAGTKAAQLDVTNTTVIAVTGAILIAALVIGVTQKSFSSNNTTSSTTSTSSTS